MSTKQILLYCVVCLALTLGVVTVLFEHAALTSQAQTRANTPQPMETFKPIDLGTPYGTVSMTDLVGYYLEHPPKAATAGAASQQPTHIGGC